VVDDLSIDALATTLRTLRDGATRTMLERRGSEWAHRRTWRDVGAEIEAALLRTVPGVTPRAP
jgi:hypothetical protein